MSSGIVVDSNIFIEQWRLRDRSNSFYVRLESRFDSLGISVITEYEIRNGMTESYSSQWNEIQSRLKSFPIDGFVAQIASRINIDLKRKRQQIDFMDLFIASTAIANGLPLATLNRKHFERINGLKLVLPETV